MMRKSRALAAALYREKRKLYGEQGPITPQEILLYIPDHLKDPEGGPFLR
jgi:hypothetical protein